MCKNKALWFIVGSQTLYGEEVLRTVEARGREMARELNAALALTCDFSYKATVKSAEEITALIKEANYDDDCLGIVVWCHTFSPSKMWINGLKLLQKPYCHLATQYNTEIPNEEIDMDFMNLNQSAHGDREHAFIAARLRLARKVIMGHWRDERVIAELREWARSVMGFAESQSLKVVRFGDNMRQVAVTEGDKVEAQIVFGWQVNTIGVGALAEGVNGVSDDEALSEMLKYKESYKYSEEDSESVLYQCKEKIAIERILKSEKAGAFTDTFEDLYGLEQLPGLAVQTLMSRGYGFGAEGDWKVAAMTRIIKAMTLGMEGGTSFMEDYTYHLGREKYSLGAHMLEVCPSLSDKPPRIEVHPLGIGGKKPPARLVFSGKAGKATVSSLIDMGGRFRLIVQDIETVEPIMEMPKLPVARVMWKPAPNLETGVKLWLLAGGAHHSVLSMDATAAMLGMWAEMMGIEFVHISDKTTEESLKAQLALFDRK